MTNHFWRFPDSKDQIWAMVRKWDDIVDYLAMEGRTVIEIMQVTPERYLEMERARLDGIRWRYS